MTHLARFTASVTLMTKEQVLLTSTLLKNCILTLNQKSNVRHEPAGVDIAYISNLQRDSTKPNNLTFSTNRPIDIAPPSHADSDPKSTFSPPN